MKLNFLFMSKGPDILYLPNYLLLQCVPRKGFGSAICVQRDSACIVSQTADTNPPNPFQGTHCSNRYNISGHLYINRKFNYAEKNLFIKDNKGKFKGKVFLFAFFYLHFLLFYIFSVKQ